MYLGVDVGVKRSTVAILDDNGVADVGELGNVSIPESIIGVGIDAPLSLPKKGYFRECERALLKMGIRLFPSGAGFFRRVCERGVEIAKMFDGFEVFEVYPFATRVILGIAPGEKKSRKSGLEKIKLSLSRFVELGNFELDHNGVDAVIAALTVKLYYDGRAVVLKGEDGSILIPKHPQHLR